MFSKDAADMVHAATRGIPRLVNQLCDLSMLYACIAQREIVGPEHVNAVLSDGAFFAPGDEDERDDAEL